MTDTPTLQGTRWINSYGSIMDLWSLPDGRVAGIYASSTGSTGTYAVVGFTNGAPPTPELGQATALSIYWRALDGGQGDPSWHWVSGLGGQRLTGGSTADTLPLLHALVATTSFPGLAPAGTYLDKLIYQADGTPPGSPDMAARLAAVGQAELEAGDDPINGLWRCREEPNLQLRLRVVLPELGLVDGTFTTPAGKSPVLGVTDCTARPDNIPVQGLSVTVPPAKSSQTLALAGSLDYATGLLTLTAFKNQGTSAGTGYVQTTTTTLTFIRD